MKLFFVFVSVCVLLVVMLVFVCFEVEVEKMGKEVVIKVVLIIQKNL